MKTWITKLKAVWGRGLPVQLPALLLAAGGAFWLAYANPSGAFSMLAMLGAACLVFLTQLPRAAKYGWCALVLCVLLPLVGTRSSYFMDVATQVGMYVVLALGLNITVGYCGLFNLGYIAFYALGAYAYGLLCTNQCLNFLAAGGLFPLGGGSFWLFLLIGGAIGCLVGFLIALPVIRISGDYLCIVTLAFCEIIRNLLNNMIKPLNITNGAKGIANIPKPVLFGKTLDSVTYMYFIVLLLAAAVILICHRLENSKLGRAWTAIREDETAARAVGIPIVKMKIASFVISACFGGVMGVVFAAKQGFVSPESFTVQISFMVLAMVILGGTGNIPGVIMGASLISILNLQILKAFSEVLSSARVNGRLNIPEQLDPSKLEKFFFGLILIIMMIFRPGGILPTKKKPVTLQSAAAHGEEAEP